MRISELQPVCKFYSVRAFIKKESIISQDVAQEAARAACTEQSKSSPRPWGCVFAITHVLAASTSAFAVFMGMDTSIITGMTTPFVGLIRVFA